MVNKNNKSKQNNFGPFFGPGLGMGWGGGRGRGFGRGWGRGLGRGLRYNNRMRCFRFPWLPLGWWANPEYQDNFFDIPEPTKKEEKVMLLEEIEILQEEMKAIKERLTKIKGQK